ncbi:hypothetical protein [Ralstonia pickettii]|uniref:hypothetical protein n=1 Tax=Ralstonia pickettii TaxID=329 RepID=UPI0015BC63F4|nr:hypothetical protein [Ralstonia pickettii]NWK43612.1 hypothetical protein [Ralstonia pickettii]
MMMFDPSNHALKDAAQDRCFLCGEKFPIDKITREHVFPKWLQRRLDIWNRQLTLVNGTRIKYRSFTAPACVDCNGISLSSIEDRVATALPLGAEAVRALGHEILYVWLSKLMFGALYVEALLPSDRSNHHAGPILPSTVLENFRHLHFMMQAARTSVEFHSFETKFHASVLVFPVQRHPSAAHRFMYRDDVLHGCIAVRLDTVGLICVADGGAQERLADEIFPKLFSHNLHPLQFEEICAKVFAKARTQRLVPKYVTAISPGRTSVTQMPFGGMSGAIFGDWDQQLYALMLADFTGYPLEIISPGEGKITSWIGNYDEPSVIDVRTQPWP